MRCFHLYGLDHGAACQLLDLLHTLWRLAAMELDHVRPDFVHDLTKSLVIRVDQKRDRLGPATSLLHERTCRGVVHVARTGSIEDQAEIAGARVEGGVQGFGCTKTTDFYVYIHGSGNSRMPCKSAGLLAGGKLGDWFDAVHAPAALAGRFVYSAASARSICCAAATFSCSSSWRFFARNVSTSRTPSRAALRQRL